MIQNLRISKELKTMETKKNMIEKLGHLSIPHLLTVLETIQPLAYKA
jgi:hypothetical protein